MTKREAKRAACRHVANLIDSQLAVGWDTVGTADGGGIYITEEEVAKVTEASPKPNTTPASKPKPSTPTD